MSELKYWLWLSLRRGIARADLLALLERFGSPENIYFAGESEYKAVMPAGYEPLLDKSMARAREIMALCAENGWTILTLGDATYPVRLRNIFDPPLLLYIRGRLPDLNEEAPVAIVGTRSCTPYGLVTAERVSYEAAKSGAVIVTGMARGIDTAAVRGALRAGGRVIGVLGSGIDIVYPKSNELLFDDVAATGALITEFAPGTPPSGSNFPVRNRILSGISLGVALVEAPERSGALITASLALEQGRDVFVIPGNVDADSCRGSNALLKEGAIPVLSGLDIVEQYRDLYPDKLRAAGGMRLHELDGETKDRLVEGELAAAGERRERKASQAAKTAKNDIIRNDATKKVFDNGENPVYIDILVDPETLTLDERSVLGAMDGVTHIDDITVRTGLPPMAVMSALTILEISGCVVQKPGKFFEPHFKFK